MKCRPFLALVLVILLFVNVSKNAQYLTVALLLLVCILLRLLLDLRLLPRSFSDLRFLKLSLSRLCSLRALSCPATFKGGVFSDAIFSTIRLNCRMSLSLQTSFQRLKQNYNLSLKSFFELFLFRVILGIGKTISFY